ncbi:hypothetical protein Dimus_025939 [Dionaea muscipula]
MGSRVELRRFASSQNRRHAAASDLSALGPEHPSGKDSTVDCCVYIRGNWKESKDSISLVSVSVPADAPWPNPYVTGRRSFSASPGHTSYTLSVLKMSTPQGSSSAPLIALNSPKSDVASTQRTDATVDASLNANEDVDM